MLEERYVLLIEDDYVDTRRFKRALSDLGFSIPIVRAKNPQEAYNVLTEENHLPFLIVLDLHNSEEDGMDFLQSLKETPALKTIPVVVLSEFENWADILCCFQLNIAGYMLKSHDSRHYRETIKTIIEYWQLSESPMKCVSISKETV
ncbi:response regulator [Planctomycetota bacterium]